MSTFTLDKRPDGIAVLTFDLPGEKVNKLTTAVMEELDGLLDELAADRMVRALVIRSGKADTFIAGADIAEIRNITDAAKGEELSRRGQAVLRKIEELPFPSVAAVHGACLGGGLELALACDGRIVSDNPKTQLGLPEIRLGIIPGFGGTQRLPRLIGLAAALDLILTGRSVRPEKALRIGLADAVTRRETLLDEALAAAQHAAGTERFRTIRGWRPVWLRLLEGTPLTRALFFRRARRMVAAETRGNYPAPFLAIEAVRACYSRAADTGYAMEARFIGSLIPTEASKNLIHVYYLNEVLKRDPRPSPNAITRIGVIGAGVMGGGIAQLFAEKGIAVRLRDVSTKAVGAGLKAAADLFRKRVAKGTLDRLAARDGMDRIAGTTDAGGFGAVDLVVEAVVEDKNVKQQVLADFEAVARAQAIFASNTSSLSITGLASIAQRPGQVVGMHFFNPVEKMPLVEIVRGKQTSPETVSAAATLSRRLGKLPVIVNDGPGFLVNRILMPYLGEAVVMFEEGGSLEAIDAALMRFGMPMGAFVLLDEIGIDIAYKVAGILREGLGERIVRSELLGAMVRAGFLGKKSGKGFYRYRHGRREGPDPAVAGLIERRHHDGPLIPEEIVDRAVLLMIKEAALCMEEGIIDRAELLDAALVFGIGFPPFRGGLLRYADRIGAKAVVEKLNRYAGLYGERYAPPASLVEKSRDDFITQIVR